MRINAGGGVLGRKLQLGSYDDGATREARTFASFMFLEQDRVAPSSALYDRTTWRSFLWSRPRGRARSFRLFRRGVLGERSSEMYLQDADTPTAWRARRSFFDLLRATLECRADLRAAVRQSRCVGPQCLRSRPSTASGWCPTRPTAPAETTLRRSCQDLGSGAQAVLNAGFAWSADSSPHFRRSALRCRCTSRTVSHQGLHQAVPPAAELVDLPARAAGARPAGGERPKKPIVTSYKRDYKHASRPTCLLRGAGAYDA